MRRIETRSLALYSACAPVAVAAATHGAVAAATQGAVAAATHGAVAAATQAYALGQWDVAVLPTLVPIAGPNTPNLSMPNTMMPNPMMPNTMMPNLSMFGVGALTERTFATHNYKGATHNYKGSAKGEGIALSIIEDPTVSALRDQAVQIAKVQGGDARGIPPRGRPV